MNRLRIIFHISFILLLHTGYGQTNVKVSPDVKYQQMKGWGGSLCWWANMAGGFSDAKVDEICRWITSPDELNMNVFRFNIGGGDNPAHNHLRTDGGNMPGYKASATAPYNWAQDANQRKILLKLNSLRADAINEAFSNSPPYWMTKSSCASGNTDGSDNLRDDQYAAFADYLTEVTRYYKQTYGITFKTLTPFNEPFSNWWKAQGGQEGCMFNQANQQKMIRELHASLTAKNMLSYCSISSMDANSLDEAVNGINGYANAGDILPKITQINSHSYYGNRRAELWTLARQHGKELWQSETGPLSVDQTGMANYLVMAQRIITDLRDLKPVVWCDWQLMSDNDPRWGLIPASYSNQTYRKDKSYYVRMQCSRFIKQGYTIIHTNQANTIAALSPNGNELVVVVCNETSATQNLSLDLTSFATVGIPVRYTTSANENCARSTGAAIQNKQLSYSSPALAITTFVIPVTLPAPVNGSFQFIARHSNKVLEATSTVDIIQNTNTNSINQKWNVTFADGYYKIINAGTGLAMDVNGASLQDGASVITYSYSGNDNQLWLLHDLGNGYFELINKFSNKVVDVPGVSTADGVLITQYASNNGYNQQFLLSPVLSATIQVMGASTFCSGGSVVLNANTGTGYSYQWKRDGVTISNATASSYTAVQTGSYTVAITANNQTATSMAAVVTVNPTPGQPTVSSPVTYCQNATATSLTATGTSLKWYTVASNGTGFVAAPVPATSSVGTTNYYVTQTMNGCESPRATLTVAVTANPSAEIIPNGTITLVQGGSVTLNATTGTGLTHKWLNGSSVVGTGSSYTAASSGNYLVEVTNTVGCKASSAIVTVIVNANQPSVITVNSPSANATISDTKILIDVTVHDPDGSITKVAYYSGGVLIDSSTTAPYVFEWNNPGTGIHDIIIKATDSNGGVTTSDPIMVTVIIPTGILSGGNKVFTGIYPNPSAESFTISSDVKIKTLLIKNIYGKELEARNDVESGQSIEMGKDLSEGTYFVVIEYVSGTIEVAKLIKLK